MGIGNRYGRNLSGVKRNLSRVFLILVIIIIGTYSVPLILLSEEVNFEKKIFNVGLKLLDFEYVNPSGKKEIITTAIWYPSETSPVKYIYHVRKDFESKIQELTDLYIGKIESMGESKKQELLTL